MTLLGTAVAAIPPAFGIFVFGTAAKARHLLVPRKFNDLPGRGMEIKSKPVTTALWDAAVTPFTRYHVPANPLRSAAWAGFHLGVLLVLYHGIGALYTVLSNHGVEARNVLALVRTGEHSKADWLNLLESLGGIMILVGGLILLSSRVSGTTGGMRRAVDGPTRAYRTVTLGVASLQDVLVLALVMSLAATGMLVHYYDASLVGVHALLAALLLALLPFTKLFHFVFYYWVELIHGVGRRIRGTTA